MRQRMITVGVWLALVCLQVLSFSPAWAADPSSFRGTTPNVPSALLSQYTTYADAIRRHDWAALHAILTPGFTVTDGGTTVTLRRAYRGKCPFGLNAAFLGSDVRVNKLSVVGGRAVAFVEQDQPLPLVRAEGTYGVTVTYYWIHHWLKTPEGWRLYNISRNRKYKP